MAAHADADEARLAATGSVRSPRAGHVLYLRVGAGVEGPTVLWNVTRGGDFFVSDDDDATTMVSVPAVTGRLTRFAGNRLHAVPRPADLYWTLREDDDDDENEDPLGRHGRHVLLFNLWPTEEGRLENSGVSRATAADDNTKTDRPRRPNPRAEWKRAEIFDVNAADAEDPPPSTSSVSWWSWFSATITTTTAATPETAVFQIPLMGDETRRGIPQRTALLETRENAPQLFRERTRVVRTTVRPPRRRSSWLSSFLGIEL